MPNESHNSIFLMSIFHKYKYFSSFEAGKKEASNLAGQGLTL